MNRTMKSTLIAAVAALGVATMTPALALNCFEVFDRSDVLIYRDTVPPVDLSAAGAPAREAMRARGETLVFFDTDVCIIVGNAGATPGRPLTTEEIIAEWKSFGGRGRSGVYASAPTSTAGPAAAPGAAPAAGPINLPVR